jgi:hypothetical protein
MYAETIETNQPTFFGLKCKSADDFDSGLCCAGKHLQVAPMGEKAPNTTRGTFYLVTNREPPHVKPMKESVKCSWVVEN